MNQRAILKSAVKVSVTGAGTLVVDRSSLHASDAYKRQVDALREVVRKEIGKAPPKTASSAK